jgi:hypothetical protein
MIDPFDCLLGRTPDAAGSWLCGQYFLTYGLRIYALTVDIRYPLSLLEGSPKVNVSVNVS